MENRNKLSPYFAHLPFLKEIGHLVYGEGEEVECRGVRWGKSYVCFPLICRDFAHVGRHFAEHT